MLIGNYKNFIISTVTQTNSGVVNIVTIKYSKKKLHRILLLDCRKWQERRRAKLPLTTWMTTKEGQLDCSCTIRQHIIDLNNYSWVLWALALRTSWNWLWSIGYLLQARTTVMRNMHTPTPQTNTVPFLLPLTRFNLPVRSSSLTPPLKLSILVSARPW